MSTKDKATTIIAKEEGYRAVVYRCTEGFPTVGYGQVVGNKGAPIEHFNLSMPERVARVWLSHHVSDLDARLHAHEFYKQLDSTRQAIILSMAYQMGLTGLLRFRKTIAALDAHDYEAAASEMLDSRWARQTPARAERHAETIRTGGL